MMDQRRTSVPHNPAAIKETDPSGGGGIQSHSISEMACSSCSHARIHQSARDDLPVEEQKEQGLWRNRGQSTQKNLDRFSFFHLVGQTGDSAHRKLAILTTSSSLPYHISSGFTCHHATRKMTKLNMPPPGR